MDISFESAIAPRWRDGSLRMQNLKIIRNTETHNRTSADKSKLDTNFTQIDLSIDQVDVKLSLLRWFDGKGIIEECQMKGVRGVVNRRDVHYPADARSVLREALPSDFNIKHFTLEDFQVEILNMDNFRPYNISIFAAEASPFRQQWLLFDILNAESVVGMYDDSLFSIHTPIPAGTEQLSEQDWVTLKTNNQVYSSHSDLAHTN